MSHIVLNMQFRGVIFHEYVVKSDVGDFFLKRGVPLKMLHTVYEELFYSGLARDEYLQIRVPVAENNRKAVIAWSVSIGLFWLLSLFLGLFIPVYAQCSRVYIGGLVSSIITWYCATFLVERNPWLLDIAMVILFISIMMAGIGIAICQPHDRTATMIAVAVMLPGSLTIPTIRSIVMLCFTIVAYCILGKGVIDAPIYSWGLLNICIFSLAGILSAHVINKTRFRRYLYEDSAKKMVEMQARFNSRLVMGMATMVENRDQYTGGHIRRTSTGVRFLVEEMRKDSTISLSDEFCDNIIKAAPMHDLGKIAVDDAILRKPGKYTPEEYEQMKKHAAEGARILGEILADTDDNFRRLAQNVAHYHHERMDGTGYPEGLKGEAIPLEARIMAIADVYDALVSKRVYKERFSPEKANQIILSGMGTQFDPKLRKYYESARPRLEAFYASEQEGE